MTIEISSAEYRKLIARERAPRGANEESQVTWSIIEYLAAVDIAAARTQAGEITTSTGSYVRMAPEGWPDITGCLPGGRMLAVEVKTNEGELRPAQCDMLAWLEAMGALVIVARSIDDVRAALKEAGVKTREVQP